MTNSIFVTHSLLIENEPKIIEYATFFGSYKIIEFIQKKYDKKQTLWPYAHHHKNFFNFMLNNWIPSPFI